MTRKTLKVVLLVMVVNLLFSLQRFEQEDLCLLGFETVCVGV